MELAQGSVSLGRKVEEREVEFHVCRAGTEGKAAVSSVFVGDV